MACISEEVGVLSKKENGQKPQMGERVLNGGWGEQTSLLKDYKETEF